jgi:hypothetical protein
MVGGYKRGVRNLDHIRRPDPFLEVRLSQGTQYPTLLTLCAGYESGKWRATQFAEHLIEWLPEFCLKYSEIIGLGSHNAVRLLKSAAANVYSTGKFEKRGEVGEIILHAAIRQTFNTIPLVSKIFYKDASNDTVKGFDSVHIVKNRDIFELWLGEVKLYKDFNLASRDVCKELKAHTENDYLRKEFAAICNKLDENHPHSKEVAELLNKNTSLDKIFKCIVFPVLITYESNSISCHNSICAEFMNKLESETKECFEYFKTKLPEVKPLVHLITIPLGSKESLITAFDRKLGRLR